jgi:hypothetical protein
MDHLMGDSAKVIGLMATMMMQRGRRKRRRMMRRKKRRKRRRMMKKKKKKKMRSESIRFVIDRPLDARHSTCQLLEAMEVGWLEERRAGTAAAADEGAGQGVAEMEDC